MTNKPFLKPTRARARVIGRSASPQFVWAISALLALTILVALLPWSAQAGETDATTQASETQAAAAPCIPQAALDQYIQLRWERIVSIWDAVDVPKNATIFAGSSIIEEGPWNGLFPTATAVNRGIGADTTQGLLNRLDQIIRAEPRAVFLYIGGNDFSRLGDRPEGAFERLGTIVERLNAELPETKVYVHTLFPREASYAANIRAYNDLVLTLPTKHEAHVIDVFDWFATESGAIDPKYSNDNIHLSGEAYGIWADTIRSYVEG